MSFLYLSLCVLSLLKIGNIVRLCTCSLQEVDISSTFIMFIVTCNVCVDLLVNVRIFSASVLCGQLKFIIDFLGTAQHLFCCHSLVLSLQTLKNAHRVPDRIFYNLVFNLSC